MNAWKSSPRGSRTCRGHRPRRPLLIPRKKGETKILASNPFWVSLRELLREWSGRIEHAPNRGDYFASPSPPLFPKGHWPFSCTRKPPLPVGIPTICCYRISCMNPLFSPTAKMGAKGDAKWWTSIRCMFELLREWGLPISQVMSAVPRVAPRMF